MRLEGKIAIITGGAQGIGRAASEHFAAEGAKVVIADINEEGGTETASAITKAGGTAQFVHADVSNEESVRKLFIETMQHYGELHVLYNNASVFLGKSDAPVTELETDVWDRLLAINLGSVFLCCKNGIPLMIESGGGSIINTGSSASVMGIPGCDAYTAAKGATVSMTRSMAVEYGPKGIRVNCICPAGIDTPMVRASSLDDPDFDADFFFSRAPLGRLGTPLEVAQLAAFLASDESSYLNGAIIRADGGITIAPIT